MMVQEPAEAKDAVRTETHDATRRRPWWVWTAPFAVVAGVLLVRNNFIFSTRLYEDSDMGANSILIEQARKFALLVGIYSRDKFNHPGPAFLYVQSWGESVFWAGLHVVPTAWNGQLIAVYALNALFAALVAGIGYGLTRSVRTAAAFVGVLLAGAAVHPAVFSSDWMPYMLVTVYIAYLLALASVASGRLSDAWIAALAGWFCINGNVVFLFFVPVTAFGCLLALAWPRRHRLLESLRSFAARRRAVWVPVAVISALFALPIALHTVAHWPGEFGKYLSYSSTSTQAGSYGIRQVARYVLWFWWPGSSGYLGLLVAVAAYLIAGVATWRMAPGPVRRFLISVIAFNTVSSAAFVAYAAAGIDKLSSVGHYIGYFYWSAPLLMLLVIVVALVEAMPSPAALAAAAAAVAVACAGLAAAPQTRTSTTRTDPANVTAGPDTDQTLPATVARMASIAGSRPVVLRFSHDSWRAAAGVLVQAERTGVHACVADPFWRFMMTNQFICTRSELRKGVPYQLSVPAGPQPGRASATRLRRGIVTRRAK